MNLTSKTSDVTRPVQIGIVGYGWWGKIMAKQIATSKWLKLTAIVEVDEKIRQQMSLDPLLKEVQEIGRAHV